MTSTLEGTVAPERQQNTSGRFYMFPGLDGREEPFWSVTTALQAYAKDGLKWWAAQLSSQRAMANLPMLVAAQLLEPCGRTYARTEPLRCGTCPDCVQRWLELFHLGESTRRKLEGTALHDVFEHWIQHGEFPTVTHVLAGNPEFADHPELGQVLPAYMANLRKWINDYAALPEDFLASEMTVFNDVYKYGGTLDAIWRIKIRNQRSARLAVRVLGRLPMSPEDHAQVVVDLKSREGEGKQFYDEHALQLAAYRAARWCMPSKVDRLLKPMLPTNGALILQVRPDGYTCEPVRAGDPELQGFLGVLAAFRWSVDDGPAAIAVKSFPVPEGFDAWYASLGAAEAKPPRKAAKRAAKKTAPAPGQATTEQSATERPAPGRQDQDPPFDGLPAPGRATTATRVGDRPAPGASGTPPRIANATLANLAKTGRPRGAQLDDEDIPF